MTAATRQHGYSHSKWNHYFRGTRPGKVIQWSSCNQV